MLAVALFIFWPSAMATSTANGVSASAFIVGLMIGAALLGIFKRSYPLIIGKRYWLFPGIPLLLGIATFGVVSKFEEIVNFNKGYITEDRYYHITHYEHSVGPRLGSAYTLSVKPVSSEPEITIFTSRREFYAIQEFEAQKDKLPCAEIVQQRSKDGQLRILVSPLWMIANRAWINLRQC